MKIILMSLLLSLPLFAKEVVLDVRTADEYTTGHVKDSLNLDVQKENFKEKIANFDKNDHYLLYCRSGRRSQKALETMKSLGFQNVENLGGYEDAKKKLEKK